MDDLLRLLSSDNSFVVGGDYNAHHELLSGPSSSCNGSGRCVFQALMDHPRALPTPPSLNTRVNPSTGKSTTIDLTIVSGDFSFGASIKTGPFMGSDHLPFLLSLNETPLRVPRWILNDKKWADLNASISSLLN